MYFPDSKERKYFFPVFIYFFSGFPGIEYPRKDTSRSAPTGEPAKHSQQIPTNQCPGSNARAQAGFRSVRSCTNHRSGSTRLGPSSSSRSMTVASIP